MLSYPTEVSAYYVGNISLELPGRNSLTRNDRGTSLSTESELTMAALLKGRIYLLIQHNKI